MRLGTLAFLAGLLIFHAQAGLPDGRWAWALPAVAVLGWGVPRLRLPAWGLAGYLWGLAWMTLALPPPFPAAVQGEDIRVEGWIDAIPEAAGRGTRFAFAVDRAWQGQQPLAFAGRVQLTWYDTPPPLHAGDRWALTVRLKRPRGLANPGGFDHERWLFVSGVAARGYVRPHPAPRLLAEAERDPVDRWRQQLAGRIRDLLPGSPYAGILAALAVGDRQGISDGQWEVMVRTGTGHLMAISGLHIGIVAGLMLVAVRRAWTCSAALVRLCPALPAAAVAALLAAAGYALLAGLSLPTRRALVMTAVALLALLARRPIVPGRILALALLAVLLLDPTAPLTGGFWLSFVAVAAILLRVTGRLRRRAAPVEAVSLQLRITLALLPLSLLLFQQLPLGSPLANLLAIPWASMTLVPLTLLAVLAGLASDTAMAVLLHLAALSADCLWRLLTWLDRWPWVSLGQPSPPLWTLAFALPGLVLLLAPRGWPGRWLGGVLCLPLLWFPLAAPPPPGYWFTLLDVGQGLAAVVRTAHHVLVYDTGPWQSGFDAGRLALVPWLRQQGAKQVDMLIVSHADRGHSGGTRSLLEQFPARRVLTASPREVPIEGAEPCRAGTAWTWDGVDFEVLHPPPRTPLSGDDASCVLRVAAPGGRVLLTGDIGAAAAAALLRTYGDRLTAEVLVAPQQGARPPPPRLLAAVRPRYVLFSTGYLNRYGHPPPAAVAGYRALGAQVLDTVQEGAITLRLEQPGGLEPQSYRRQTRRYWHDP